MWHVCDDLHFTYKTLQGDGSITAKIERIDPAHYGIQAGLMIRNTLDSTSSQASLVMTPLGDVAFEYRTVPLTAIRTGHVRAPVRLPHWIRLTRTGDLFTADHSGDGVTWESIDSSDPNQTTSASIPSSRALYIGLALASQAPSRIAEAHISNVTLAGPINPDGPFTTSHDVALQLPSLSDNTVH